MSSKSRDPTTRGSRLLLSIGNLDFLQVNDQKARKHIFFLREIIIFYWLFCSVERKCVEMFTGKQVVKQG